MILQLTSDCYLTTMSDIDEVSSDIKYTENYTIYNCSFGKKTLNGFPDIVFHDNDTHDGGQYRAIGVNPELYELVAEPMTIRILDQLEFDDSEEGIDYTLTPAKPFKRVYKEDAVVKCLVYGYYAGAESVGIEMPDGACFCEREARCFAIVKREDLD